MWYDIGDKKAVEKTSQALREGAPKLRQLLHKKSGGDSSRDLSKSPVPERPPNNKKCTVDKDGGKKRKKEEPSAETEASAANIAGNLHNHMMQGGYGSGGAVSSPQVSRPAVRPEEEQDINIPPETFAADHQQQAHQNQPHQQQHQPYHPTISTQMPEPYGYPSHANHNMQYGQQQQQFQYCNNSIGSNHTNGNTHQHSSPPQARPEPELPGKLDIEPDPIPFGSAHALQVRRASQKAEAPHEASLIYDNHRFVPRHSMFRGSGQSILTDYSDMLDDIRSFDPDEDAFDDDLMNITAGMDPLPSSNNLVVSGLETINDKLGGRSRYPSFFYGDRRKSSSRSSKRDSLMSILSDITDISAALNAVQMEDAEDEEAQKDGKIGPRRQSVRFSAAEKESSRRGGFAINEFMAQDVNESCGKGASADDMGRQLGGMTQQRNSSSLRRANAKYKGQDMSQAAAFLNDANSAAQGASPLQGSGFGPVPPGGAKGSPGRASQRTSSVRFSLPPQDHFDLNKIVNADGRGSFCNGAGISQRGSFAAQRRDTASSLLRRSILSNFTVGEMSFLNEEELSDDDNDFGGVGGVPNNAGNQFDNPMMIWNAADTNVRNNQNFDL
jgi:hypothetical protein